MTILAEILLASAIIAALIALRHATETAVARIRPCGSRRVGCMRLDCPRDCDRKAQTQQTDAT